jgi:hypothetical protein
MKITSSLKRFFKNSIAGILEPFGVYAVKIPDNYSLSGKKGFIGIGDIKRNVINTSLSFTTIDQFASTYEIVKGNTMVPFENLASLFDQVEFLERNGIEGDFVECGVWKGGSVGVMASANMKFGNKRRALHLFDSFDDICEPDPKVDGERAIADVKHYGKKNLDELNGALSPIKGIYESFGGHGTIEACKELLLGQVRYDENYIKFYPGWFQNTFPIHAQEIEKIAILRLDSDWYASTKICLEYFYDKVVNGGFIIIDDYGAYEGCKKAVDEFLDSRNIHKYLINASSTNAECFYFIK